MTDTTIEIQQIQRKLFQNKTLRERFEIGAETIDFGRMLVVNSILNTKPNISELELKTEVLKRYYGNLFSETEYNEITQSLIAYLKRSSGDKQIKI